MNPAISHLRELGSLDGKLQAAAERRRQAERTVESAESELAEAEAHLGGRHDEIIRLQKDADAFNVDVLQAESDIERFEGQLRAAKSNKEYDILQRQLEEKKEKKSDFEDRVLEGLERVDAVAEEKKVGKTRLEKAGRELEEVTRAAEALGAELAKDVDALTREREGVIGKLDSKIRRLYEKVLAQRRDSALGKVVEGVCSACVRKLTPQFMNLVDAGEEIIQCMGCQRILYLDDGEAGR